MTSLLLLVLFLTLVTYAVKLETRKDASSKPGQYWQTDYVCQTDSAATAWRQGYGDGGASTCSTRPTFWNGDPYDILNATGLNKVPTIDYNGNVLPPGSSFKADDDVCAQQQDRFPGCKVEKCVSPLITLKTATKKYNKVFCSSLNTPLPFNERDPVTQQTEETKLLADYEDFKGKQPPTGAHWYEAVLNYDDITSLPSLGRLFTTRVPNNLEYSAWNNSGGVLNNDRLSFQANLKLHKVDVVIMLPITSLQVETAVNAAKTEYAGTAPNATIQGLWGHEELSPEGANSMHLVDFYKALGLTMFMCPMNDFMPANPAQLVLCVEAITAFLIKGKNVLVHCYGGSGRTGMMVMSVAKLLGVPDVITRLRHYPGKSVFLDVHEQELMIQQMPRLWSPYLTAIDYDGQVKDAVDDRWHVQISSAWKENTSNVVQCPTGPIVLNDRCQTMASCRGCMPEGNGEPGKWPLKGEYDLEMPNGYERKPVIFQRSPVTFTEGEGSVLQQSLESTNNYWYNAEPITHYDCIGDICEVVHINNA